MSSRIEVDMALNASGVAKGAKDAEKALGNLEDAVNDAGRDGAQDMGKLEASLKDVQRQSEKTTDSAKDVGGKGFSRATEASMEFKDETLSNLSEVTSSFDGSMSSIGDLVQGTLGGIAGSIPGIGLLGGAAAVGVGLITAELDRAAERAQFLKDRIGGIYQQAAEDGRAYIDTAQIIAESQDLIFNPDRAAEWKQLRADSIKLGLDESVLIAANTGDLEAQEQVRARVNGLMDDQAKKNQELGLGGTSEVSKYGQELVGVRDRWQEVANVTQDAREKSRIATDAAAGYFASVAGAAAVASGAVKGLNDQIAALPSFKTLSLDVDLTRARSTINNWRPVVYLQGEVVRPGKIQMTG